MSMYTLFIIYVLMKVFIIRCVYVCESFCKCVSLLLCVNVLAMCQHTHHLYTHRSDEYVDKHFHCLDEHT